MGRVVVVVVGRVVVVNRVVVGSACSPRQEQEAGRWEGGNGGRVIGRKKRGGKR